MAKSVYHPLWIDKMAHKTLRTLRKSLRSLRLRNIKTETATSPSFYRGTRIRSDVVRLKSCRMGITC